MSGSVASHFAKTVFCWFPPERLSTGFVGAAYLILNLSRQISVRARSFLKLINNFPFMRSKDSIEILRSTPAIMKRPCWRRSSGTSAIFSAIAATGEPLASSLPFTFTVPAVYLSIPKIARATSDRPEPTRPARATISPRRTLKEMLRK